jgi:hypothetical protein
VFNLGSSCSVAASTTCVEPFFTYLSMTKVPSCKRAAVDMFVYTFCCRQGTMVVARGCWQP